MINFKNVIIIIHNNNNNIVKGIHAIRHQRMILSSN